MLYLNHIGQLCSLAKDTGVQEAIYLDEGESYTKLNKSFVKTIQNLQKKGYQVLMADSCSHSPSGPYIEFNQPRRKKLLPSLPMGFEFDKISRNVRISRHILENNSDSRNNILETAIDELYKWVTKLPLATLGQKYKQ